jgi:hypothetical protein
MYTLRQRIGEEAVNTALRRFYAAHADDSPPRATSLDLLDELRAVTPDSLRFLITDWFETVTLWDVSTERAVVELAGTGEWTVTLDVVAKKMRADSVGNETEVPMDDFVEIGVYAAGEIGSRLALVYLEPHRIVSGRQTIRVTVSKEPGRAGVDPRNRLIDRKRDDNVVRVEPADMGPDR